MSKDKFKISLRENGEHSLKRSLESYREHEKINDHMLLKDTIMFLHQSIELLSKQMLINHSPYLIFEDLKDIPKKQKEANKRGIGIFFLDKPPRSVTYEVAIDRVEAFLNPPELDETLKENLNKLNRLRNQLEHYEIEADHDEVVQILEAIHKSISNFFEKYLGPLTQLQAPQINQTWENIDKSYREERKRNHEVFLLMQQFNGQKVPGRLLGVDGEVILPKFESVHKDVVVPKESSSDNIKHEIDIFAQSAIAPETTWIVETKVSKVSTDTIYKMFSLSNLFKATPWIVNFGKASRLAYVSAKESRVMITGSEEWNELKNLIVSSSPNP